MFSGEPHMAHHYYGELLKIYCQSKKEMYQEHHDPWPYFISALSYVALDRMLKAPPRNKYRPYRDHLLNFIARKFFGDDPRTIFKLNEKRIAARCQELVDWWNENTRSAKDINDMLNFIESYYEKSQRGENRWDAAQRRDFTEGLYKAYKKHFSVAASERVIPTIPLPQFKGPRIKGTIRRIGVEFGFIVDQSGQDVFFHRSALADVRTAHIVPGTIVEFTPVLAPRGLKALDVIALK